jgi:hypothetical protein
MRRTRLRHRTTCAMIRVAAIHHPARTGIRALLFVIESRLSREAREQWLA